MIVAMGGASLRPEDYDPRLNDFVLSLARSGRPRVCFVPTASGDSPVYVADFYRAFSGHHDCDPSDLGLFERTVADLRGFVLSQDVIWVGGGNTATLLAVWRMHGLDVVLREAWEQGVVLCGVSAGMNCWFEGSTTDSFDLTRIAALPDGLGLLPGSCCPHYDGEEQRRPLYTRLVADGELAPGYAADDAAALVFDGTELAEVVTTVEGSCAYRVTAGARSRWPPGCSDELRLGRGRFRPEAARMSSRPRIPRST